MEGTLAGTATIVTLGKFMDMLNVHSLPLCRSLKCKVDNSQWQPVQNTYARSEHNAEGHAQVRKQGLRATCFTS